MSAEDFEPSHEEHESPLPLDITVIPSEETLPFPHPPTSVETPQNFIDTDDLLVKYAKYI